MDSSLITSGLLTVAIVFPILATVAVALRFYAHKIKSQGLKADDSDGPTAVSATV